METLQERLLIEQPHVDLGIDPESFWDFCSEEEWRQSHWMEQLITLYRDGYMISLNKKKNDTDRLMIDPQDLDVITDSLIDDYYFINFVKNDLKNADFDLKFELSRYLPKRLKDAIGL